MAWLAIFAKDNWALDYDVPMDWDMDMTLDGEMPLDWEVSLDEVVTLDWDTQPRLNSSIDAAKRPFQACHWE